MPPPRHAFSLEVMAPGRPSSFVNLGPHPPRLWPEDMDRLHNLWLRLSEETSAGAKLHHRDVVGLALQRLEQELDSGERARILDEVEGLAHKVEEEAARDA